MQKLYEYSTGNQCALSNININAKQIKRKKRKDVGERGKGMTSRFLCCTLNMVDSVLSCLTSNSCTCINSASFSWFVLFSIPNKRSLVVKLIKFAGKYLDLASTNIGQTKKKW